MTDPNTPPAPLWFRAGYITEEQYMQRDDQVQNPSHYDVWEDLPAIEVMARTSTEAEFRGFCRNTGLKYRLRAGKKGTGTVHQDIAKCQQYQELFNDFKHMCIPEVVDASPEDIASLLNTSSEIYAPRKNDQ